MAKQEIGNKSGMLTVDCPPDEGSILFEAQFLGLRPVAVVFAGTDVVDPLLLGFVLALVVLQVAGQLPGQEGADQEERGQDEEDDVEEGPGIVRSPADEPLGPLVHGVHESGSGGGGVAAAE